MFGGGQYAIWSGPESEQDTKTPISVLYPLQLKADEWGTREGGRSKKSGWWRVERVNERRVTVQCEKLVLQCTGMGTIAFVLIPSS